MAQITIGIPCPDTLQPKLFDLAAAFQQIARIPNQLSSEIVRLRRRITEIEYSDLIESAKNAAIDEINKIIDPVTSAVNAAISTIENLKSIICLDGSNAVYENPEYQIEKCTVALLDNFRSYVIAKIIELISSLVPLTLTISIGGISIDLIQFGTNPAYRQTLKSQVAEKWEAFKSIIPNAFRTFQEKVGFDNISQAINAGFEWLKTEIYKIMTQTAYAGFELLIKAFDAIWKSLKLPAIIELLSLDIAGIINGIISDTTKSFEEIYQSIQNITVFGFSLIEIIGGELETAYDNIEHKVDRLIRQARDFAVNWPWYLLVEWIEKIAKFLEAIGLDKILEWIRFTFCDFLKLIGVPTSITINIPELPNES